jgi:ankyrin repeat protein
MTAHDDKDDNIWVSASDGDIDAVKAYLASGLSVDVQDENGYTPLYVRTVS